MVIPHFFGNEDPFKASQVKDVHRRVPRTKHPSPV